MHTVKSLALAAICVIVTLTVVWAVTAGDGTGTIASKTIRSTATVTVTPVNFNCQGAIAAARRVSILTARYADIVGGYPPLISKAYMVGARGTSAAGIVREIRRLNREANGVTDDLRPEVAKFNSFSESCY